MRRKGDYRNRILALLARLFHEFFLFPRKEEEIITKKKHIFHRLSAAAFYPGEKRKQGVTQHITSYPYANYLLFIYIYLVASALLILSSASSFYPSIRYDLSTPVGLTSDSFVTWYRFSDTEMSVSVCSQLLLSRSTGNTIRHCLIYQRIPYDSSTFTNRYIMIAHHGIYSRVYRNHWIALMILFCWLFSYGMQVPTSLGIWGESKQTDMIYFCYWCFLSSLISSD